jgi:hypothetical protein
MFHASSKQMAQSSDVPCGLPATSWAKEQPWQIHSVIQGVCSHELSRLYERKASDVLKLYLDR